MKYFGATHLNITISIYSKQASHQIFDHDLAFAQKFSEMIDIFHPVKATYQR